MINPIDSNYEEETMSEIEERNLLDEIRASFCIAGYDVIDIAIQEEEENKSSKRQA